LLGRNNNGNLQSPSSRGLALAFIANAMPMASMTALYNAVQVFQTTLGRNV